MRRVLALLILVGLAAPLARAQERTMPLALAELIHEAMPLTSWSGPHDRWDAVSIRISRLMHWHLAGPDTDNDDAIQRKGWVVADGQQVGVTAHGDREHVTDLVFEGAFSAYSFQPPADDRDLFAALTARGVTVTEIERHSFPDERFLPLDQITYTLSAEGHHPTQLTRTTHCTSPGSRAARRCWIVHALTFSG